jgi:hypothetical protein
VDPDFNGVAEGAKAAAAQLVHEAGAEPHNEEAAGVRQLRKTTGQLVLAHGTGHHRKHLPGSDAAIPSQLRCGPDGAGWGGVGAAAKDAATRAHFGRHL